MLNTIETNAKQFAFVIQGLINIPSKILGSVSDMFDFYDNLSISSLLTDSGIGSIDVASASMAIMSSNIGYTQASMLADEAFYITKSAVFNNARKILEFGNNYLNTIDNFAADNELLSIGDFIDNNSVEKFLNALSISAKNLNAIAFLAKQERSIMLSKNEELYSLVYRILGADNIDDLDNVVYDFMRINNINGSDMFELEQGKILKYYV